MIKVDLITGFLGAGKTTFIIEYAKYLEKNGIKTGIIINDFGAINVDRLLLKDLEGALIEVETVVGGNVIADYRRRLRTKLISMAMRGFKRIIVEPSGIFNALEFFDILADDTLTNWYIPGNVFTIVDGDLIYSSKEERYLFTTEASNSSKLIIRNYNDNTLNYINAILKEFNCSRFFDFNDIILNDFNNIDFDNIINSGYIEADYEKIFFDCNNIFNSVFLLNYQTDDINNFINELFNNPKYGNVIRVKGFIKKDYNTYFEINATKFKTTIKTAFDCQEVVIIIGSNLNETLIKSIK